MGSSQSNEKQNDDQSGAGSQKRDLYKVLGVDEFAGQDEYVPNSLQGPDFTPTNFPSSTISLPFLSSS